MHRRARGVYGWTDERTGGMMMRMFASWKAIGVGVVALIARIYSWFFAEAGACAFG